MSFHGSHYIFFSILIFLMVACKGRSFRAGSNSMESTIIVGDHFYVTRSSHFERNDIVVFNYYGNDYSAPPDEFGKFEQHWEKRVFRLIAFSGDSLEIKDGEVIVN